MSTRAVYSFRDPGGDIYHVYKHSDGYPTGAARWLLNAKKLAWQLPRYEADEFAASFVAVNKFPWWCEDEVFGAIDKSFMKKGKKGFLNPVSVKLEIKNPYPESRDIVTGGGVRLLHSGGNQTVYDVAPGDIEYRYEVYMGNDRELRVKAYDTNFWEDSKLEDIIFDCKLDDMEKIAKDYEDKHR